MHTNESGELPTEDGPSHRDEVNLPAQLPNELDGFASRLAAYAARPAVVDRDTLMFAAGQASRDAAPGDGRYPRRYRAWQTATVAMTLISITLGSALILRRDPEPRVVVVERERSSDATRPIQQPPSADNPGRSAAVTANESGSDEFTEYRGDDFGLLADAWKARQAVIASGGWPQSGPATVTATESIASHFGAERPLTRTGLLGEGSLETIQQILREEL